MKKYYKIIYSKKIRTDKGDIYKYNLISKFFNTGIKDFYFSEVNKNKFSQNFKIIKHNSNGSRKII